MKRRLAAPVLLSLALAVVLGAQEKPPAANPQAAPTPATPAQAAPAGQAPAATPSFPTQLEQVIVDVVVTDKKGVPIQGLKASDMTVTEDGVKQDVVSFEAVELPEQPSGSAPPPPKITSNVDRETQQGRTFVIVFDDMHITPWRANQAKAAVVSFLEKGTREGDRVSLISTAGGTWWTSRMEAGRSKLIEMVKTFDGRLIPDMSNERMSDYEAMRIHVYRDPQVAERVLRRYDTYGVTNQQSRGGSQADTMRAGTVDDPMVTGRAAEVYFQAMTRLRTTLDVTERALNGLASARGRKSLILVSEGFIHDINLDEFKRVDERGAPREHRDLLPEHARPRGHAGRDDGRSSGRRCPSRTWASRSPRRFDAVAGSEVVSSESGGFIVRNTNDLNEGIQRIADETRVYYLLGYMPTNAARDGKFRKIEVKLALPQGPRGARAQGLLRAERHRQDAPSRRRRASTPRCRVPSTRRGRSTPSRSG